MFRDVQNLTGGTGHWDTVHHPQLYLTRSRFTRSSRPRELWNEPPAWLYVCPLSELGWSWSQIGHTHEKSLAELYLPPGTPDELSWQWAPLGRPCFYEIHISLGILVSCSCHFVFLLSIKIKSSERIFLPVSCLWQTQRSEVCSHLEVSGWSRWASGQDPREWTGDEVIDENERQVWNLRTSHKSSNWCLPTLGLALPLLFKTGARDPVYEPITYLRFRSNTLVTPFAALGLIKLQVLSIRRIRQILERVPTQRYQWWQLYLLPRWTLI